MGRRTLVHIAAEGSALLLLSLAPSCARLDARELLPPASLPATERESALRSVGVVVHPVGSLPLPPSWTKEPATLLPMPFGDALEWLPGFSSKDPPKWQKRVRGSPLPRLIAAEALHQDPLILEGAAPWWTASDDSAAMALAGRRGLESVLVVRADVGPEDERAPLPDRLAVAADVSLLSVSRGETWARGYDRISLHIPGEGDDALERALRRAGRILGARLRNQLQLGPSAPEARPEDEDDVGPGARK